MGWCGTGGCPTGWFVGQADAYALIDRLRACSIEIGIAMVLAQLKTALVNFYRAQKTSFKHIGNAVPGVSRLKSMAPMAGGTVAALVGLLVLYFGWTRVVGPMVM